MLKTKGWASGRRDAAKLYGPFWFSMDEKCSENHMSICWDMGPEEFNTYTYTYTYTCTCTCICICICICRLVPPPGTTYDGVGGWGGMLTFM